VPAIFTCLLNRLQLVATRSLLALLVLFALAAMALVWFATPNGPILSPDSISYIRSVRLLQTGAGVLALDNHWPPGYAVLLSATYSLLGSEMLAARMVCALSLALSMIAIGIFTARLLGQRSTLLLVALVLLAHLLAPGFSLLYLYGLSEAPFLAALCWALVAYQRICTPESGRGAWVLLATCLAAMLLLRYAALPIVAAFMFSLAVHLYLSGRRWLGPVFATGLAAIIPLMGWLLLLSPEAGDGVRQFTFHGLGMAHYREIAASLARWMGGVEGALAICSYLVLLAMTAWQWLQTRRSELLLLSIMSIAYLLFLTLSLLFFDAHTPLNARILLPLFPPFVLMLVAVCTAGSRSWRGVDGSAVLVMLLLVVTAFGMPGLKIHLKTSAAGAMGSANVVERSLELYRKVAALPADVPVYSNTSEILFLVHGREVKGLPLLYAPLTMQQNQDFIIETAAMIEHMYNTDGVLLWMPVGRFRTYYPNPEVLLGFPLKIIDEADGGYLMVADVPD
jgi:hypothetical protein